MKTKLFNALKQDHSKLGLSDEVLQAYADSLASTGLVTDENLATISKGQETALKAYQSSMDKERTEKASYKKELDELKAKGGKPEEKPEPETFTKESIAQLLAEAIKPFAEKITTFETQTKSEKRNADILAKAKEYGVPETFVSRFKIGDEEDVDTYMKGVKQDFANIGFEGTTPPEEGAGGGGGNDIAELISKGTKEIVEQSKK